MKPNASLPPLSELLRKSRELRTQFTMHSDHAVKLKVSIAEAKKRAAQRSLFSPE